MHGSTPSNFDEILICYLYICLEGKTFSFENNRFFSFETNIFETIRDYCYCFCYCYHYCYYYYCCCCCCCCYYYYFYYFLCRLHTLCRLKLNKFSHASFCSYILNLFIFNVLISYINLYILYNYLLYKLLHQYYSSYARKKHDYIVKCICVIYLLYRKNRTYYVKNRADGRARIAYLHRAVYSLINSGK